MFYIFTKEGNFIATSDFQPNLEDHESRNEIVIENDKVLHFPILVNGELICTEERPSTNHIYENGSWILPKEKLKELKLKRQAEMWSRIKDKRYKNAHEGGCYVPSVKKWFHTDEPSRIQYLTLRTMDTIPKDLTWKTMDNSFVPMTKELLDEITNSILMKEQADFANAERHRLAMLESDNPLEYDYSGGWQKSFKDK